MKKQHIWTTAGIVLTIVGLILGINPLIGYLQERTVPQVAVSPFTSTVSAEGLPDPVVYVEGKPVHLEISSLGINLDVADGKYNPNTQKWTLSSDKAHYAVMTPLANNGEGNTFIYGHNKKSVFRDLHKITLGDQVIITTDNGHRFVYSFKGALETVPTDTSLFDYKGKPILTIQTCSGAFYQNRQLFTFDLESAV